MFPNGQQPGVAPAAPAPQQQAPQFPQPAPVQAPQFQQQFPPQYQPTQQFAPQQFLPQYQAPSGAGGGVGPALPSAAPAPATFPNIPGQQVIPPAQPQQPPAQSPAQPTTTEQQAAALRQELQLAQNRLAQESQARLAAQYQASQLQQRQPAPGQQAAPASPYEVPAFDASLMQFIREDPTTGAIVETPGAPPGTLFAYTNHRQAMANLGRQLPHILKTFADQQATATKQITDIQAAYQQEKSQRETDKIIGEVEPWAVAKDPTTGQIQMVFDYQTGQHVAQLTPLGQAYDAALREAANYNINSAQARHKYAMQRVDSIKAQMPRPPQQPMQQQPSLAQQFAPMGSQPMQFGQPMPQQQGAYQYPGQIASPGLNGVPRQPGPAQPNVRGPRPTLMDMARQVAAQQGLQI